MVHHANRSQNDEGFEDRRDIEQVGDDQILEEGVVGSF